VQSIGAIALDPKNSKNVWVGTGESWTRNSVSIGDGIYKSTDGGETWSRAGLEKSERIGRIVVDPRNGDTVFAAVPGALWSDSPDRGLYKTTDGGKTWQLVLKGANLSTGCTDVEIDPSNPDIMFAAMWDFRRKGWEYRSGGAIPTAASASGLFRSTDGGNTWTEITEQANKGFPKIEIATRLRICRIAGERVVRVRRRRRDLGETRQKSVDGLASFLLREPDC
jgi:photosystem II stability/assembly factor-like uncharacterized protein